MAARQIQLAALIAVLLTGTGLANADRAADHYDRGRAMLAQADLLGAFSAFSMAVALEPANPVFREEMHQLRRVLELRYELDSIKDHAAWRSASYELYDYYENYEIHNEQLSIAVSIHDRYHSPDSTVLLANAHLALGHETEALFVLERLPASRRTVHVEVLHGVTLARMGRLDQARKVARRVHVPDRPDWRLHFDCARLYTLVGDYDRSYSLLEVSLGATDDRWLKQRKSYIGKCRDFQKLPRNQKFGRVMHFGSRKDHRGQVVKPSHRGHGRKDDDRRHKGSTPRKGSSGSKDKAGGSKSGGTSVDGGKSGSHGKSGGGSRKGGGRTDDPGKKR